MKRRVYLPDEIISQIITSSGLDLKSKIKCMVVCKQWRNLVSDHISDHYKGQFLVYDSRSRQHRFGALDGETNQIAWMCGEPHLKLVSRFMSTCNGLVCFLSYDSDDIYICNPLTGECISIPGPPIGVLAAYIHHCGLGFCLSSNEYKLTCLTTRTLETYTLGSSTGWRSVPFDHKKLRIWWRAAIYVNGVFHWLLKTQSILTFDLATEVLGTTPPPLLEDGKEMYKLACMDHCLVVTAGYKNPMGFVGLDIWERKEDKVLGESVWTKNWIIDVDQPLIQICLHWLVPQKLSTNGRIIMRDLGDKLYSYDSRDKLVRHSWDCGRIIMRDLGDKLYSYDSRDKLVRHSWDCDQFGGRLYSYYTPTLISPKKLIQKDGQELPEI